MGTNKQVKIDIGEHLNWLARVSEQVKNAESLDKDSRLQAKRWENVATLLDSAATETPDKLKEALAEGNIDPGVLSVVAGLARVTAEKMSPAGITSWTKQEVAHRLAVLNALHGLGAFTPEIAAEVKDAITAVEDAFPKRGRRPGTKNKTDETVTDNTNTEENGK